MNEFYAQFDTIVWEVGVIGGALFMTTMFFYAECFVFVTVWHVFVTRIYAAVHTLPVLKTYVEPHLR